MRSRNNKRSWVLDYAIILKLSDISCVVLLKYTTFVRYDKRKIDYDDRYCSVVRPLVSGHKDSVSNSPSSVGKSGENCLSENVLSGKWSIKRRACGKVIIRSAALTRPGLPEAGAALLVSAMHNISGSVVDNKYKS